LQKVSYPSTISRDTGTLHQKPTFLRIWCCTKPFPTACVCHHAMHITNLFITRRKVWHSGINSAE